MTEGPAPTLLSPDQFRELYNEHAGPLCGYLTLRLRGDSHEAQGCVQEAFLKAWEKRHTLRDPSLFRSWLYSIAMNELRQRKRKLKPLAVVNADKECERPSPEKCVSSREELDRVRDALDTLSDEQREAILLVRVQGMKFREAAETLGVSENTIKTRVRRGLIILAEKAEL